MHQARQLTPDMSKALQLTLRSPAGLNVLAAALRRPQLTEVAEALQPGALRMLASVFTTLKILASMCTCRPTTRLANILGYA